MGIICNTLIVVSLILELAVSTDATINFFWACNISVSTVCAVVGMIFSTKFFRKLKEVKTKEATIKSFSLHVVALITASLIRVLYNTYAIVVN